MTDHLRRTWFAPYATGDGPRFSLTTWEHDTKQGRTYLRYRLTMCGKALFEGDDFGVPPTVAIDSDETLLALMKFLCLRPRDTDADYFFGYTEKQIDFCNNHADALYDEAQRRLEKK